MDPALSGSVHVMLGIGVKTARTVHVRVHRATMMIPRMNKYASMHVKRVTIIQMAKDMCKILLSCRAQRTNQGNPMVYVMGMETLSVRRHLSERTAVLKTVRQIVRSMVGALSSTPCQGEKNE